MAANTLIATVELTPIIVISRLTRGSSLGWSTRKLAELADVGLNTVNRFEGGMNSRENNIGKIRVALEKAGIEFDTDGQGVRLRPPKPKGKRK